MIPFNTRFKWILPALLVMTYTSGWAQYYFGQNKVQYNRFDWQLISTTHFDIYFYRGEEQLARTSAVYAEDSYYDLSRRYHHEFFKKIPLIVYSSHFHFQETNTTPGFLPEGVGGFTEFLKGRVVMPFNGSYPNFKRILQHELVHAFMIDKIITVFKEHNNYNYYAPPLWFSEGLAEHWSAGWNNEADMFMRDAMLNNYLYPISSIYAINGSFLMYKEGQSFLKYLEEQYGDYQLTRLFQEMWRFDNFYDLFEYIYQIPLIKADENWQYSLRKHYLPLFREGDLEPFHAIQQTQRGFNFKPALIGSDTLQSPSFFFLSSRMGYLGIYRKSIQTDTLLQIPDRAELIIKGNLTKEFESFHFMQSKLAVRDSILVFVSRSEDSDVLYFYNYYTRRIQKKKRFDHLIGLFYPAWSPDGNGICFSAVSYTGERDLYFYLHQSDSLIQLTNDFYDDLEPVIAPDNRSLIFSSDRGPWGEEGYYHLYLMDMETRTIRELTEGHHNYQSPVWKDSSTIFYTSDCNGAMNIYQMNLVDDQHHQITRSLTGNMDIQYSPHQNSLLYTGLNRGTYQIYYKSLDETVKSTSPSAPPPLSFAHPNLESHYPEWNRSISWKRYSDSSRISQIETQRYKTRLSMDIAQSSVTYDPVIGTSGGIQFLFSDMLGNTQYYFLIGNTARTRDEIIKNFNLGFTYVNLKTRLNYGFGAYHLADYYTYGYSYDETYFERKYGVLGLISYPINRFERLEFSCYLKNATRDWYQQYIFDKALLGEQIISYVIDRSMWGVVAPLDGYRVRLTLGLSENITERRMHYLLLLLDARYYYRLAYQSCWATRIQLGYSSGQQPHLFWLGGSWSLRGYDHFDFIGRKLIQVNNELRFPFIQHIGIFTPLAALSFNQIEGALFMDVGNAWSDQFDHLYGDFGMGMRLNLWNALCLRLDFAKTTDFKTVSHATKIQFFFGWSY